MKFPHRPNCGGTTDSICPRCFVTVGTSTTEADLNQIEEAHHCDPVILAHLNELLETIARIPPGEGSEGSGLINIH
jgi:hypothetical protein